MKFIKVNCDWCGIEFEKYEKKLGDRNFCCVDCVNKHRSKKHNPEGYQRNWNAEHLSKYNIENNHLRMTDEVRAKLRKTRLGTGQGKSYEKTYGRHTHRIVAEKKIGRPLRNGEVVHHVDGDKRNNHPDNLIVFASQAEHLNWHRENDKRYGGEQSHG